MAKVYTLGTSNRSFEEFLAILKQYQIEVVADVRRWPISKRFEYFKKENLEKILKENNIQYFHFEDLGGYRSGGYQIYLKTKEFKKALKELEKITKINLTVIICAERFPWKCHRALISQALENRNFEVFRIIEKNRIWQPKKEPKEIKPKCQKIKFIKKN